MVVKRIIDATRSDFEEMSSKDLIESVRAAEGRAFVAEVVVMTSPPVDGVSSPEIAAAFGADMIVLNMYNVEKPMVMGISSSRKDGTVTIADVKRLVGRPVGINLEPVDPKSVTLEEKLKLPTGRLATKENLKKAMEQGADFVHLTGNPKTGVTNHAIKMRAKELREEAGDKIVIFGGKMHSAGAAGEFGAQVVTLEDIRDLIKAGCDGVILPAPGTIPGIDVKVVQKLVLTAHDAGGLAMSCMGTSQEGADVETIRRIAIYSKMAGVDIHHIGDSGYMSNVAIPKNIMAYSIAMRGVRHTYRRMAMSIAR